MKTYDLQTSEIEQTTNNPWEAFLVYLESIYFEGAADLLDSKLICFEYHEYIQNFC